LMPHIKKIPNGMLSSTDNKEEKSKTTNEKLIDIFVLTFFNIKT
jgi:hypothetical protein